MATIFIVRQGTYDASPLMGAARNMWGGGSMKQTLPAVTTIAAAMTETDAASAADPGEGPAYKAHTNRHAHFGR